MAARASAGVRDAGPSHGDAAAADNLVVFYTKDPFRLAPAPQKIRQIEFGIQCPEEISRCGEIHVHESKLYKMPERSSHPGGVLDGRLGISNKQAVCQTCEQRLQDCAGHFGFIRLHLPVFHVGYINNVLQVLQCICKTCSRVMLKREEQEPFRRKFRSVKTDKAQKLIAFRKLVAKCKLVKNCPYCGEINGTVKKAGGVYKILHDKFKGRSHQLAKEDFANAIVYNDQIESHLAKITDDLNPLRVYHLLERIPEADVELLDLKCRPEHLLISTVPVPPVCIRPSIEMEGIGSNEDDISMRLSQVIEYNTRLRVGLEQGLTAQNLAEIWDAVQVEMAVIINSDVPGLAQALKPERKVRGYVQRLKGKSGRFRGNLSGKRVDFSGRTVISPDPNLGVDEVAIPRHIAVKMTFPQHVNQYNMDEMQACILNGTSVHPGANMVIKQDGSMFALKRADRRKVSRELKAGDIVERHLRDGDIVLFNRQPSLHRNSIMAHKAKVKPWRTLRFNECVCSPYNADFDGDEMNIHLPQTQEARTEAALLMGTVQNLSTPKNGDLLICATQDFLTCAYLLTSKDKFLTRAQFCLMCCYMMDARQHVDIPHPSIVKPVELWTGKQLWNVLVRPNAKTKVFIHLEGPEKTYSKRGEEMCPNDGYVHIRNSELIAGRLGKGTLGGNKGGFFGVLNNDVDPRSAAECMNRLAKLSSRFMGDHGFSIGIDDVTPANKLAVQYGEKMHQNYKQCDDYIQLYRKGQLQPDPGLDEEQTLEAKVTGVLNEIRTEAGKVCMESLHWHNSPLIMSLCGAKGSPINIAQMVACVGQQSVNGKRCFNGFTGRSLPHFPRGDRTPQGKGFVANSFYSGLTPTEFFFHTMAGREGLVDTAVKTAETGYMSRRLMKALEDLYAHYDSTVRDSSAGIVQFKYGDDALDPLKMEGKSGEVIDFGRLMTRVKALSGRGVKRKRREDGAKWLLPEDLNRLISDALHCSQFQENAHRGGLKGSVEIWCSNAFRNGLAACLRTALKQYQQARERLGLPEKGRGEEALEYLAGLEGLTAGELRRFMRRVVERYETKRIEPGTTVGAVGAQSIGEPGTQMTLKTFHFAGVASMNVTLGVPRIKEIINASKSISTPIMDVTLDTKDKAAFARLVKGRIERTTLGQVAREIKTVYQPGDVYVSVVLDLTTISKLQLEVDAYTVRDSILDHAKLKLGPPNVHAESVDFLTIHASEGSGKELLLELYRIEQMLPHVMVAGIATIKRAVIRKDNSKATSGKYEYRLLADGTDLLAVMGVTGVAGCYTQTNHVMEVARVLGIEAGRKKIISEIRDTMEHYGMVIDNRHTMLLADCMTYKGEVLGITRNGITKMKDSVLHAASFEKTTDHLFDAAVHGRVDSVNGVSESIIMGAPMPTGTGMFKLLYNQEGEPSSLAQRPPPILSS
ncbi:unnamed protein product [Ostreobium quekettii]|uniref:DNA-directed RNA polymerase subunit n=1 Tax=Ostreobium quekettii TaxID=121088 RepID=A0A8S1J4E2_9CHLO|nr:unnamed protein product [Ostreobium quekettii]|eukprot:evm.model.scf_620.3 EVM.evm.TU.scf_620.3   scf_620:17040-31344(-)